MADEKDTTSETDDAASGEVRANAAQAAASSVPEEIDIPGVGKVARTDIEEWRLAHAQRQKFAELEQAMSQFERDKQMQEEAIRRLVEDPREYEKLRERHGLAKRTVDPLQDPYRWTASRADEYRRAGHTDEAAIVSAVRMDLLEAQNSTLVRSLSELRQGLEEAKLTAQESRAAAEIERVVEPLYVKYPAADTEFGREMAEALMLREADMGKTPDYEGIVKKVADFNQQAVRQYVTGKKTAAAATSKVGTGGAKKARYKALFWTKLKKLKKRKNGVETGKKTAAAATLKVGTGGAVKGPATDPLAKVSRSADGFYEIADMIAKGKLPLATE